jgi:hypothetical protein
VVQPTSARNAEAVRSIFADPLLMKPPPLPHDPKQSDRLEQLLHWIRREPFPRLLLIGLIAGLVGTLLLCLTVLVFAVICYFLGLRYQ